MAETKRMNMALVLDHALVSSDCQLKFRLGLASDYSKQIDIVPIANNSVRFVHHIVK